MGGILIRGHRYFTAEEVIDHYQPRRALDAAAMAMVRECARAVAPATPHAAWSTITTTCGFVTSAIDMDWTLDPVLLFTDRYIEWHCRKRLATLHPEVRATARSRLRRVARAVSKQHGLTPPPASYARRAQAKPYEPGDIDDFESLVPLQPTQYRARILTALLSLCAGAGVRSQELVQITAAHVRFVDDFVILDVPGPKARSLPVRRRFDEMLRGLVHDVPEGILLGNVRDTVRSPVHHLSTAVHVPDRLPTLSVRRLRATWIAQCLQDDVPFSSLVYAAGVNDLRLADWIPFVANRPDANTERAVLAGDPR